MRVDPRPDENYPANTSRIIIANSNIIKTANNFLRCESKQLIIFRIAAYVRILNNYLNYIINISKTVTYVSKLPLSDINLKTLRLYDSMCINID